MIRNQRGITLIALVITIIVMLILAGVSISMTVGQNGILTQASNAVVENRKASAKEEIAIAWASLLSDYWTKWAQNSLITKQDVFTEANMQKYLNGNGTIKPGSFRYDSSGISKIEYISGNETYKFDINSKGVVSATIPWTLENDADSSGDVSVGDEVKSGTGERFYVINIEGSKIIVLAKYNLATSKNASGDYYQQNETKSTVACAFSGSQYWTTRDINLATGYVVGDAQEKAIKYGKQNGGEGRLLEYGEVYTLKNSLEDIIIGTDSKDGKLFYWLGTTFDNSTLNMVRIVPGSTIQAMNAYSKSDVNGVRPVIEISDSDF